MRLLIFLLPLLLFSTRGPAQTQATLSYEAYALKGYLDTSLDDWNQALAHLRTQPESIERSVRMAYLAYGAAGSSFALEEEVKVDVYLDIAEESLAAVLDQEPKNVQANAILSGVLGLRIARKPMKGMTLGSKSARHAKRALDYGPDNPVALFFFGSRLLYTPKMWGGDPERAVELLQRAVDLGSGSANDWTYLNALALLGQAQAKTEQSAAARTTYKRALALQPEFGYVKYNLLPALDQ